MRRRMKERERENGNVKIQQVSRGVEKKNALHIFEINNTLVFAPENTADGKYW